MYPVLECNSSISGVVFREELEKIPTQAARFVTSNYDTMGKRGILKWETKERWQTPLAIQCSKVYTITTKYVLITHLQISALEISTLELYRQNYYKQGQLLPIEYQRLDCRGRGINHFGRVASFTNTSVSTLHKD